METLKMWDLTKDDYYTSLYKACTKKNVDPIFMCVLVSIAQDKFITEIPENRDDIPPWPRTYTREDIEHHCKATVIALLAFSGLLRVIGDDTLYLTDKAMETLILAKELKDKGIN